MNKVSKLGMLFNEGNVPDFGSIQMKSNNTDIYYLSAQDIPKLNDMLTKEAAASYLTENETLDICSGALAFVVDHQTANSGKIYVYHREQDHWYEFNIRSDLGLWDFMWNRHARILRETKEISGTPPLTFKSNGRPLKNYRIYGNTVNGESVGDPVTEGEHAREYCIKTIINGINMFNALETVPYKYINGNGLETGSTAQTPENFLNHTPYIRISPLHTYTFKCTLPYNIRLNNTVAFCWFDNNKSIINRNTSNIQTTDTTYAMTYTAPANAEYLVVNFIGYIENAVFMLNEGSVASDYEPFHETISVNLYVHEAVATGKSISAKETEIRIPTIKGTNTITFETAIQPSTIELTGKIIDLNS